MIDWYYLENIPNRSPSQFSTLQLIAEGREYIEVASIKGVSAKTIRNQLRRMRKWVGAKNTVELVHLAHQAGIL